MTRMLAHSNPYTRALGALYLRYSIPPDQLLDWMRPLIDPPVGEDDPAVVVNLREPPVFVLSIELLWHPMPAHKQPFVYKQTPKHVLQAARDRRQVLWSHGNASDSSACPQKDFGSVGRVGQRSASTASCCRCCCCRRAAECRKRKEPQPFTEEESQQTLEEQKPQQTPPQAPRAQQTPPQQTPQAWSPQSPQAQPLAVNLIFFDLKVAVSSQARVITQQTPRPAKKAASTSSSSKHDKNDCPNANSSTRSCANCADSEGVARKVRRHRKLCHGRPPSTRLLSSPARLWHNTHTHVAGHHCEVLEQMSKHDSLKEDTLVVGRR